MKHLLAISLMTIGATTFTHADFIGAKASVDYWYYDSTGDSTSGQDFNLDNDHAISLTASFEHPIPLIPNAKIKYSNLQSQNKTDLNRQQSYEFDVDYSDFILYYELLDNIVSLDVGLGAKVLDGDLKQNLTTQSVNETLPMIYAQAGVKLPFTGLSAQAEANYASYDDTVVTDAQAEVKYNFIDNLLIDVGAKLGYRLLDIKFDEGKSNQTNFEFKGPYIGLEAHF